MANFLVSHSFRALALASLVACSSVAVAFTWEENEACVRSAIESEIVHSKRYKGVEVNTRFTVLELTLENVDVRHSRAALLSHIPNPLTVFAGTALGYNPYLADLSKGHDIFAFSAQLKSKRGEPFSIECAVQMFERQDFAGHITVDLAPLSCGDGLVSTASQSPTPSMKLGWEGNFLKCGTVR